VASDPPIVWVDAQVSPAVAEWMSAQFGVHATHLRDLALREADDPSVFAAARAAGAIVLTKDSDFVELLARRGPPPRVVWLTCGNTSNVRLRRLLLEAWPRVMALLAMGEPLIEVSDRGA
jgi:predicted nuclease of predicted toxin-antitoxin system